MKSTFAFALLGAVALAQRYYDDDYMPYQRGGRNEEDFMQYIAQNNKFYSSQAEFNGRRNLFMKSTEAVKNLRMMSPNARFGVNYTSDWTDEEYQGSLGLIAGLGERQLYAEDIEEALYLQSAAPYLLGSTQAVDWRTSGNLSPVKDQGYCGSCWVFNSSVVMETMISSRDSALAGSLVGPVQLSEQEGVDCVYDRDGCEGGWPDDYWEMTMNRGGAQFAANYPYTESYSRQCKNQSGKTASNPVAVSYGRLPYTTDGVIAKLEMGPLSVALAASNNVFRYYEGGIVRLADNCPTRLDHAVALVAYTPAGEFAYPAQEPRCRYKYRRERRKGCPSSLVDNGQNECCEREGLPERTEQVGAYWTIQNSWGTSWGEDGFMNLEVTDGGSGVCGMNNYIDYLVI